MHSRNTSLLSGLLFTAILWFACSPQSAPEAELILRGAKIYTMDPQRSWAEALAIADGKIIYVGTNSGVEEFVGKETRAISLNGEMILPGFHDSHVHPVSSGIELGQCSLSGLSTQEQIFKAIRSDAEQHPNDEWFLGGGWDLPVFPGGNPDKHSLDRIIGDRPAQLVAADGHSAWVNSKALEIAGITKSTPNPPEGRIERDPRTGEPSGTLREAAIALVSSHIPELTPQHYVDGLRRALQMANRFGITSLHEASADDKILAAYAHLDSLDELTARVIAALHVDQNKDEQQVIELIQKREKYKGKLLRATAAKIFADGVIESRTAAMLQPYVDRPDYFGIPNFKPEVLSSIVARLDSAKFQVHVHAIGDSAIRMALNAFERAQQKNDKRDARHMIAHLELIDPGDIPRFQQLGVVANFQPLWAYADPYITELTEPALGTSRSRWLYPIASVAKTGAMLAAGSDWSVSSMNPLDAIQVAVTRRGLNDSTGASWIPEEVVDLPTILAAYTINGAFANHQEQTTGSIEVGKAADLIVLDRNLFEIPKHEIHRTRVVLTMLEGRELYRDPSSTLVAK